MHLKSVVEQNNIPVARSTWTLQTQIPFEMQTKKTDIITDISLVCRFLSTPDEKKPQINLDSFFAMGCPPEEQTLDLTNQAELIKFVKQMRSELVSLKSDFQDSKNQNKILKAEIVELKTKLGSCIPAICKTKPDNAIHDTAPVFNISDGSDGDNESEDSESQFSSISDQSDPPISKKNKEIQKTKSCSCSSCLL